MMRTATTQTATFQDRWLWIARIVWVILAALILILISIGVPAFYNNLQVVCVSGCTGPEPSVERIESLAVHGLSPQFYAGYITALDVLLSLTFTAVATLIFWRKSHDRMTFVAGFTLLLLAATASNTVGYAGSSQPQLLPVTTFIGFLGSIAFVIFFSVFPNGQFVPRWTLWLAIAWGVWQLSETLLPVLQTNDVPFYLICSALILAQIIRYRQISNWEQRQQTKWVVFGFAVGIGFFIMGTVVLSLTDLYSLEDALHYLVVDTIIYICFLCIPVSLGIAVLRSNLWGINVIIRKALVYGVLTGLLGAFYFGSIILLQVLLGSFTEERSPLIIVLSTLLIAALFNPLRRRIQTVIDRRFFRKKYNAQQVLAHFAQTARDEVDMEALQIALLQVVQETLQPEQASLWLKKQEQSL